MDMQDVVEPAGFGVDLASGEGVAELERALTELARAVLRIGVPEKSSSRAETVDRAGHWLLLRVAESEPVRLSDLADLIGLDLSTVSRQARNLADAGLLVRQADPADGRATLLSLSEDGRRVLDAVLASRRETVARLVADWSPDDRALLIRGLSAVTNGLAHKGNEVAR
jgi:DNA-binding MarR family transcriptional regulator